MPTTTPPVGISIVSPAWATTAATPRMRSPRLGVEPPGRKLLSGEVTTRSGGTQVPWPPSTQSPYWTLNAPLGIVRGFGDRHALEGAAQPVDGIGSHEQALEDVVRDRLILERVAAGAERERAERRARAARGSRAGETRRAGTLSLGSGW